VSLQSPRTSQKVIQEQQTLAKEYHKMWYLSTPEMTQEEGLNFL